MSLPRYERYKASGVEWLGEVPEGWEVQRLRFVAQLNPSKVEIAKLARDTEVSFLPMDAVGDDGSLFSGHCSKTVRRLFRHSNCDVYLWQLTLFMAVVPSGTKSYRHIK